MTGAKALAGSAIVLTADTPWIVPKDQPEAMQRAPAEVERGCYKVLGHRPIILQTGPEGWTQPLVRFGISGKPGAPATFSLKVEGKTLAATGADSSRSSSADENQRTQRGRGDTRIHLVKSGSVWGE